MIMKKQKHAIVFRIQEGKAINIHKIFTWKIPPNYVIHKHQQ